MAEKGLPWGTLASTQAGSTPRELVAALPTPDALEDQAIGRIRALDQREQDRQQRKEALVPLFQRLSGVTLSTQIGIYDQATWHEHQRAEGTLKSYTPEERSKSSVKDAPYAIKFRDGIKIGDGWLDKVMFDLKYAPLQIQMNDEPEPRQLYVPEKYKQESHTKYPEIEITFHEGRIDSLSTSLYAPRDVDRKGSLTSQIVRPFSNDDGVVYIHFEGLSGLNETQPGSDEPSLTISGGQRVTYVYDTEDNHFKAKDPKRYKVVPAPIDEDTYIAMLQERLGLVPVRELALEELSLDDIRKLDVDDE